MNKKVLFCDLDGTLIETISGDTFPKGIWDMKFKMDVIEAIKKMKPDWIFIVSNQDGIEKGLVDVNHFTFKIQYIVDCLKELSGVNNIDEDYCSFNDKQSVWRKPNTGMLEELVRRHITEDCQCKYKKEQMLMIGDASGKENNWSVTDKKTAENYGIDYLDIYDFIDWVECNEDTKETDVQ